MTFLIALLVGTVAGLRAMLGPVAVSWAAQQGWLALDGTPLASLGFAWTPYVFTILAVGELVTDQLPNTPSRKVPMQFGRRIVSGALCGAAVSTPEGALLVGLAIGAVGAAIGTLVGAEARARLIRAVGRIPAAPSEDSIAIVGALVVAIAI